MEKLSRPRLIICNTLMLVSRVCYVVACELAGRPAKPVSPRTEAAVRPPKPKGWEAGTLAAPTQTDSNVVELEAPPAAAPSAVRFETEEAFEIRPVVRVEGALLVLDCPPARVYAGDVRLYPVAA